jgi:hypothetical protein
LIPRNDPDEGDFKVDAEGDGGKSGMGMGTPKPDMIETVLARFIFLLRPDRLGVSMPGSSPGVGA